VEVSWCTGRRHQHRDQSWSRGEERMKEEQVEEEKTRGDKVWWWHTH
jgi:hypothetical protein